VAVRAWRADRSACARGARAGPAGGRGGESADASCGARPTNCSLLSAGCCWLLLELLEGL